MLTSLQHQVLLRALGLIGQGLSNTWVNLAEARSSCDWKDIFVRVGSIACIPSYSRSWWFDTYITYNCYNGRYKPHQDKRLKTRLFNRVSRDAECQRSQQWLFLHFNFELQWFFFLISTILTLKYNFNTKQIFVGLYISFLKKKWQCLQVTLASNISTVAPACQCYQPTMYEHSLLLNHSQVLNSLPDL